MKMFSGAAVREEENHHWFSLLGSGPFRSLAKYFCIKGNRRSFSKRYPNDLLNHWKATTATEEETELKTCKSLDHTFCGCVLLPQLCWKSGSELWGRHTYKCSYSKIPSKDVFPAPPKHHILLEKLAPVFRSPDSIKCQGHWRGQRSGRQYTVPAACGAHGHTGLTPPSKEEHPLGMQLHQQNVLTLRQNSTVQ